MGKAAKKYSANANARVPCITLGYEAARWIVEKFPKKDHRGFDDFGAAYNYMDERGCQRPHNFQTLEQVQRVDRTSKLPDGWDVSVLGPYHYDPHEKQRFDPPILSTQVNAPSQSRQENSRFLPARRPAKVDEMRAMARGYREKDSFLAVDTDGISSPDADIRADLSALKADVARLMQVFGTMAPSSFGNDKPNHFGFASSEQTPNVKEEPLGNNSPLAIKQDPLANDESTAVKEKSFVNESTPTMHGEDAALSHKLFIAGTPPRPDDDFHHDPPSYDDDDDSASDLSSDYDDSQSDSFDEDHDVADEAREPCQNNILDLSSAPSSQETAEAISTPMSSPVRRRRSNIDDEELDEPSPKKARPSGIALQPEILTHIKSEDSTQPTDHLEAKDVTEYATDSGSEYYSESENDSQSCNHVTSETNLYVETLHYSLNDKMECLRELVKLLRKSNGVNLAISGTELAPSANGTGKTMVPPSFQGQSLNMSDHGKVRLAVIELFKHYSTVVVKTERKVDVVVL